MANCRRVVGVVVQENPSSPSGPGIPMQRVRVRLTTGALTRGTIVVDERVTDALGRFSFDVSTMDEVGTDGVFEIEVYDGVLLLDTHGDVRFNADGGTKDLLICAKRPVKCLPPSEQIPGGLFDVGETPNLYGFVRHIDGTGIDGLTVRLARFTFDSVSDINTAAVGDPPVYIWDLTSLGGWFKFTGSLSLPADLLVNVYDGTGTTLLGRSSVRYQLNSGPNRFEIYLCNESLRGPSEFLRISIELSKALYPSASPHPHYTGGLETKLLDCTMEQLIWLSARTHWPLKHIADRARAEDLHNTLEIMGVSFSAEDLYGLLREGCPKNLRALLALPPSSILAAHGRAKRANVINGMMGDEDITDALKAAIAISLNEEAKDSLGEILRTTAAIDEEYITAICAEVAGFTGTDAQLWTNIAAIEVEEEPIPTEQVDEAKRLIQIATIGLGSAPVVAGIITELDDAPASTLGTWSMATWGSVATAVDDADLPLGLAGGDLTERRNSLARLLNENAALAFPATAVRSRLASSALATGLDVTATFSRAGNTNLDLRHDTLTLDSVDFLSSPASPDADAELATLRTVQRLVRLSPAVGFVDAIERLADLSVRSAQDVVRAGRARFISRYVGSDASRQAAAEAIFAKARSQSAAAAAFYVAAHPALGQANLGFVPNLDVSDITPDIPEYDTIFTAPTGTRCAWCQSVHGPSAYLVDLLGWMEQRARPDALSAGPETALDALLARRPDLGDLPLTCENVERVLPMIDLTIEILEAKVSEDTEESSVYSSEADTEEQLAGPQHINDAVYGPTLPEDLGESLPERPRLGDGLKSFLTPFHRPLIEARAFLGELGVARVALMEAFVASTELSDAELAIEHIGLSIEGAAAITGTEDEADYWSLTIGDPVTLGQLRRAADLTTVQVFDLLHSRAANPNAANTLGRVVVTQTGGDPYDVNAYNIQTISAVSSGEASAWSELIAADYTPMRRFVRLWRATGWPMITLDRALTALGLGDTSGWDDSTLTSIGQLKHLCERLGLDPVEAACWFGALDTWQDRDTAEKPSLSLYDRLFLSPALFSATEQAEAGFPFRLNPEDRSTLASTAEALSDHIARTASVLGLTTSALESLVTALEERTTLDAGASGSLSVASLSLLARWASLGRALGLAPSDALRLTELLGVGPSESTAGPFESLSDAHSLLDDAQQLLSVGFTVDELDYLIQHGAAERAPMMETHRRQLLGRLRDTARGLTGASATDLRDALVRQLAEALGVDRALITELDEGLLLGAIQPTGDEEDDYPLFMTAAAVSSAEDVLRTILATTTLTLSAEAETTEPGTIDASAEITVPNGTALVDLGAVTLSVNQRARRDGADLYVLLTLPGGVSVTIPSGVTVTKVATSASVTLATDATGTTGGEVNVEIGPIPLSSLSLTDGALSRLTRAAFLDGAPEDVGETDPWADLSVANFPEDHAVLEGVIKAVMVAGRLGADTDERRAWREKAEDWTLFSLTSCSGAALSALTDDGLNQLQRAARLFLQRGRLPGATPTFAELLNGGFTAEDLSARTGWDAQLWTDAIDASPVSSLDGLVTLIDRVSLAKQLGVSLAQAEVWAGAGDLTSFTPAIGRQAVAAARAKIATSAGWLSVARPLRDKLRKASRDALVSFLIARSPDRYSEPDDLYQDLLIDVSANPEMLTSRVVQATLAAQLFVHRAMFGLERDENDEDLGQWFNDEDRLEWDWMRTYRVWEAARKVFLYPENWIEPELRDDKTPFFEELEQHLGQGDLSDELVEDATLNYLDRLLSVGSLQVLAFTTEQEQDSDGVTDRLHVFARTRGEPPTYWMRTRDESKAWSPWEEVKAGIVGDHLVPVIVNRRLMLFWAEFADGQSGEENANPATWWDIRLAMSELRDGKWSPKKVSSQPMSLSSSQASAMSVNHASKESYRFVSTVSNEGELTIQCFAARGGTGKKEPTEFTLLGAFTLNPCTMDLEVAVFAGSYTYADTGLAPTRWSNPGNLNDVVEGTSAETSLTLNVHLADVDPDTNVFTNAPKTTVPLLKKMGGLIAVLPSHHLHFVSQTPFFVTQGERVYFVERIEEDEETTDSADPPLSGLTKFRRNTHPGISASLVEETIPLNSEDAEALAALIPNGRYTSATTATDDLLQLSERLVAQSRPPAPTGRGGAYHFSGFYHPFVCRFVKEVRRYGALGLLDPDPDGTAADLFRQEAVGAHSFSAAFLPTTNVVADYPVEDINFTYGSAYGVYNWELFFHLPFYVANQLADAGRYKESIAWYHTMFDPRTRTAASGYEDAVNQASWWKVKPLLEAPSAPVTAWVSFTGADGDAEAAASFERTVSAWRDDPFNPHLLARLRPGTYPRAVVMRYIDTLIAWGDALFTQDTLETLNEATQLYVFARQVLGDRPELLEDIERPEAKTFNDLRESLGSFSNPLVALENASFEMSGAMGHGGSASRAPTPTLSPYFCVPFNARLLSAWDTLDDRLFKIRNGMNINGVARTLPLFQPPIDPAMLVRAAAAGVDIQSALTAAQTTPTHRFSVLLGRAMSLAGSVRAHGQALLAALEKRDAEALALLRQRQEAAMLDAVKAVRERQIEEAEQSLESLRKSKAVVTQRKNYYSGLIGKGWLPREKNAFRLNIAADATATLASTFSAIGGMFAPLPQVTVTCCPEVEVGGKQGVDAMSSLSSWAMAIVSGLRGGASALSTAASYDRRAQEWTQQHKSAELELDALDKQILGAEIRVDIARRELRNHELQIRHSAEIWSWMQSKFTNHELYNWMANQLSTLHLQCWQLALDAARKAEASYNYELGRSDRHIQSTHWDGTRKGLLAGERLAADLERMDMAYLQHDVRELELTKHISLARLDPLALAILRETGECLFELPEVLFDLDCPNHLLRRISSVALSVACVAGPYGQVNMKLTLTGAKLRREGGLDTDGLTDTPAIVTSAAVEDAGLFSADPRDARYLPFERRGAISSWKLEFCNRDYPQIDWSSVSDVTVHLRYTAREGDTRTINLTGFLGGFTSAETSTSSSYVVGLSAKRDEPDAWHLAQSETSDEVTFRFGALRKPYAFPTDTITVNKVHVLVVGSGATHATATLDGVGFGEAALTTWPGSATAHLLGTITATAVDWPDEVVVSLTNIDTGPEPETLPAPDVSQLDDLIVVLELTVT